MNKLIMLLFLVLSLSCNLSNHIGKGSNFNPGHYICIGIKDDVRDIKYLNSSEIQGVSKRYFWRDLEPTAGNYDFSELERDYADLAIMKKHFVIFIMDKSFSVRNALPEYLRSYEISSTDTGHIPVRWNTYYIERFIKLTNEISKVFDNKEYFEGIAIQESSLGIPENELAQYGYSPEKYRDSLIAMLVGIDNGMKNGNVFWYSNFLPGNDKYLYNIADSVVGRKVFLGGPDILPYREYIKKVSYPMYDKYRKKLVLFCSAQSDSYKHHMNDKRLDAEEEIPENGYISMEDIFLFGRDKLHLSYIFWDYEYDKTDQRAWTFDDAIKVIKKYPSIR